MGHQCLVLDQYCMSPEKARKYVLGKLLALGLEEPIGGWAKSVLTLGSPDKPQSLAFIDMISKARKTGHVTELSREIDSKDP